MRLIKQPAMPNNGSDPGGALFKIPAQIAKAVFLDDL